MFNLRFNKELLRIKKFLFCLKLCWMEVYLNLRWAYLKLSIWKLCALKLEANHVCRQIFFRLTLCSAYSWEKNSVRQATRKITKILIHPEFLIFTVNVCRRSPVGKHREYWALCKLAVIVIAHSLQHFSD